MRSRSFTPRSASTGSDEQLDLGDYRLTAAPEAPGDSGLRPALRAEHDPPGIGRAGRGLQKRGEPALEEGGHPVDLDRVRERVAHGGEEAALLPLEQGAEELLLAGVALVDDRLGDPGGVGDRVHGGAGVAALDEEAKRGVQD